MPRSQSFLVSQHYEVKCVPFMLGRALRVHLRAHALHHLEDLLDINEARGVVFTSLIGKTLEVVTDLQCADISCAVFA